MNARMQPHRGISALLPRLYVGLQLRFSAVVLAVVFVVLSAFGIAAIASAETRVITQDGKLLWIGNDTRSFLGEGAPSRADTLVQTASWQTPGNVETGGQLCVRDVDGNGRTDLVYDAWGARTYAYEAYGDNDWHNVYQVANPYGTYLTGLLCVGDGDNDGLSEFTYGSGTSGVPRQLVFLEARHPGSYPDSVVLRLAENNISTNYLRIADLDRDGRADLIGSTQGSAERTVAIWENRGDNAYTQVWSAHLGGMYAVAGETAMGDFDGDGMMELVVPDNSVTYGAVVHVIKCTGPDAYEEVYSDMPGLENMYCVAGGVDLDRDGGEDFVVIGGTGLVSAIWTIIMYEATETGSYERVWSYEDTSGWIQEGLAIGDLNVDGYPELLAQYGSKTTLFSYAGDDSLLPTWTHQGPIVGQGGHRIVAPDLDRDMRNEAIWTTATDPGTIVVFETTHGVTSVPGGGPALEAGATALSSWPNPFREATSLRYTPGLQSSEIDLSIYDATGRRIARLAGASTGATEGTLEWRPAGSVPAGVYYARLRAGSAVVTRSVVLTK